MQCKVLFCLSEHAGSDGICWCDLIEIMLKPCTPNQELATLFTGALVVVDIRNLLNKRTH